LIHTGLAFVSVTVLSGCMLPAYLYANATYKYRAGIRGPEQVFVIQPVPKVLTEELAASTATETLAREGYKPSQWYLTFVYRDKTKATVRFTGQGRYRLYLVDLNADNVSCHSAYGTQRDPESWVTRPKLDPGQRHGKDQTR